MTAAPRGTDRRNLPHYVAEDLSGETLVLTGDEGHHAKSVRRVRVEERVCVTDGQGGWAVGRVEGFAGRHDVLVHLEERGYVPPAQPEITVVQALIKGERSTLAVELLTEVGVDRIVPWQADRSVAQWRGERAERGVQRWQRTAQEAAKQSRRVRVPQVLPSITSDALAAVLSETASAFVCHEDADASLAQVSIDVASPVVLVVGPEGGISERELTMCADAGASPVRLGPTVLRASSAGVVAAALLMARTGRWDGSPAQMANTDTEPGCTP